jgi:hypothetical protein
VVRSSTARGQNKKVRAVNQKNIKNKIKGDGMEKTKKPRIRTWTGDHACVYAVPISVREYHLRLEQLIDAIYTDLSQLPESDQNLESSSTKLPTLICANPSLDKINQGFSLD